MAHARRKFFEVFVSNKSPVAGHALDSIKALYRIERKAGRLKRLTIGEGCDRSVPYRFWMRCMGGSSSSANSCHPAAPLPTPLPTPSTTASDVGRP